MKAFVWLVCAALAAGCSSSTEGKAVGQTADTIDVADASTPDDGTSPDIGADAVPDVTTQDVSDDGTAEDVTSDDATPDSVDGTPGTPHIQVAPPYVDLGWVPPGSLTTVSVDILNTGTADLSVDRFHFSGAGHFYLLEDGDYLFGSVDPTAFETPIVVAPGGSDASLSVQWEFMNTVELQCATLRLFSNDPDVGEDGAEVTFAVNTEAPCLTASPLALEFGDSAGTLQVTLRSCGDLPVSISEVGIVGPSAFSVAPDWQPVMPPNATQTIELTYSGYEGGEPDVATLSILWDGGPVTLNIPVVGGPAGPGIASPQNASTAALMSVPLSPIVSESFASYAWTVSGPLGSTPALAPNAAGQFVSFVPLLVGDYLVRLQATGDTGEPAGNPSYETINAVPRGPLHVELAWSTLGAEPADLDLHLADPTAAGPEDADGDGTPDPWFAATGDCYSGVPEPADGVFDPKLLREDAGTDGVEVIAFEVSTQPVAYPLAVHYREGTGSGTALATVRVWRAGAMSYAEHTVALQPGDLWWVGTIDGDSGEVSTPLLPCVGPKITPNYPAPEALAP